jgi:hypothetical protein
VLRYTQNDTRPDFFFNVEREGAPVDLTSAVKVEFKLKKPSGGIVTRQLSIIDAPNGEVQGVWGTGDLSEAGEMLGEVLITWGGNAPEHGEEPIKVLVREEYSAS